MTTQDAPIADASGRPADEPGSGLTRAGGRFDRLRSIRIAGLGAVFVLFVIAGAVLAPERFLTLNNLYNILLQASVIGIVTIGLTFVILGGGIDLSVGSLVALAGVVAAAPFAQDGGVLAMVAVALAVGALAGLVNGALIAYGRVVAFITTLAMLTTARGLAIRVTDSRPFIISEDAFNTLGTDRLLGVPIPVYFFLAVAVLGWVLLNRTTFGRRTIAIGGNAEASRLAGIDVKRHTMLLYVLSGVLSGLAAVLISAQLTTGSASVGIGYELDAIAAVIIGGASLSGGRGTVVGSVLGILTLTVLANIFALLQIPSDVRQIVQGVIIVVAVLLQGRSRSS